MFTKEAENVAEALPHFVKMLKSVQNPMANSLSETFAPEPLETVSKAIWVVIPFHFLTFLGQGGSSSTDVAVLILVGLGALVALMWVGTMLGFVQAKSGIGYEDRAKLWVSGLVCTWFFSVLAISMAALIIWAFNGFAAWPDMVSIVRKHVLGGDGPDILVLSALGVTFGTLCTYLVARFNGRHQTGTFPVFFLMACWLVCLVIMYTSSGLLSL